MLRTAFGIRNLSSIRSGRGERLRLGCTAVALLGALSVGATWGGLPAAAAAGDWTTYGATNARSGFNAAETVITPTTASQLHLAWTTAAQNVTPNLVFSQPVVANGLIYWASMDGYERATNTSGGLVWQTYIGVTSDSNTGCHYTYGPSSTATVVNGVVYVGGGDVSSMPSTRRPGPCSGRRVSDPPRTRFCGPRRRCSMAASIWACRPSSEA